MHKTKVGKYKYIFDKNKLGHFARGMISMAVEIRVLSFIDHPNIIKAHGMAQFASPCESKFFLLLDCLHDTLDKRIEYWGHRKKRFTFIGGRKITDPKSKKTTAIYEKQIIAAYGVSAAIAYLHDLKILHRDLKPENVGFDIDDNVKLFDLALARELHNNDRLSDGTYKLTKMVGTLRYMAPEVAKGESYNTKCDVYSFAILFWEMLTSCLPFESYNTPRLMKQFVHNEPHKRPQPIPSELYSTMRLLLKRSWSSKIEVRYEMKKIESLLQKESTRLRQHNLSGSEYSSKRSNKRSIFTF